MPGGLVDVGPEASYDVTLLDLTTGTSTTPLSEELGEEDEAFATTSAPVALVGGHAYRLAIDTEIAQSTLALSLASGTTSLHLDNVGLTVRTASGGGDGKGGKGSGSLTDRRLFSLLNGGAGGPAVLASGGKRLLVRVGCPARVGRACRIAAQGMLSRRKPATARRVVKVGKGKAKRIALRVKPKARKKVGERKRLLVREKVRVGGARATVYKSRKLIRQG